MNFRQTSLMAAILLGLVVPAASAEKKNPLAGQPAVRHRLLLVKNRFELTPAFESSVNAEFKHTLSGGLKLEYHLTDMWSFGAVGFYGGSLNTGLNSHIVDTLSEDGAGPTDPEPSKDEWSQHINTMPLHGAAYLSLTPWYGKMAAFGKFFVNFDFYFQGGLAFASLKSDCDVCTDMNPTGDAMTPADNNPNNDPPLNDGTRLGVYLGGGIHVFMNNWLALDLTVRNYLFSDNPSGLDFNADLAVTEDDQRFLNHLFMGVGFSIFLPTSPKRTN